MRVLFATYAEKTHFLTMVPLAWALRCAGHDVRVASQPELTDVITHAGLTAVPVGRDHSLFKVLNRTSRMVADTESLAETQFDLTNDRPEKLTWENLSGGYGETVRWWWRALNDPLIDGMTEFAVQWRPDLVIWEPITYAAPIAAKACGAVHARLMWSVDVFTRMRRHFLRLMARQPPATRRDLLAHWLGAHAGRHGGAFTENMTTGHFTIDNVPGSLRHDPALDLNLDLDYLPMRYIPYNGVAVVPPWLRGCPPRPRIAVTLGVSSTERLTGYAVRVQDLLGGLADLDAEIVVTLPAAQRAQLREVPDNVRLVEFAPLNALAQTCAAIIHHGGNGSYCTTLANGVPQLVVPRFFDAALRAAYLVRQGAGGAIARREVTPAKVRGTLLRLLEEPSFRDNAGRLRDEMHALPTPNDLVPEIERRVARYRADAATGR